MAQHGLVTSQPAVIVFMIVSTLVVGSSHCNKDTIGKMWLGQRCGPDRGLHFCHITGQSFC